MNPPLESRKPVRWTARARRILWLWALSVLVVAVVLLLLGVYVGAQAPDAWYTRWARWVGGRF